MLFSEVMVCELLQFYLCFLILVLFVIEDLHYSEFEVLIKGRSAYSKLRMGR